MILRNNGHTVFAFSDTHGCHRELVVPEGVDIIICAGDVVEDDLKGGEYDDFIEGVSALPARWKLFVPGNHELSFERGRADDIAEKMSASGITVLEDAVEDCDGVIVGSVSANAHVADEDIPDDLDILVTHYPPYGVLDEERGSLEILTFVLRSQPKYHLFGHIHSTAGKEFQLGNTLCKNISVTK